MEPSSGFENSYLLLNFEQENMSRKKYMITINITILLFFLIIFFKEKETSNSKRENSK